MHHKWLLPIGILLLAACGTPETECRDRVTKMKDRMVGVIGSGEHKGGDDPVVQAHTQLNIAETQLATGNYEGCLESLDQAGAFLRRSQRTNQQ